MTSDDWIRQAVEQHSSALTLYATHLVGSLDRARDAVQDTFIKLCKQPREEVEHKLKEWLYVVCRNRALDIARKENRMSEFTEQHEPIALEETALEQKERAEGLLDALETLPPNQREVIRLKFLHGHSYREISGITELSQGNVGFLIHTGLKTLRRKLAPMRAAEGSLL